MQQTTQSKNEMQRIKRQKKKKTVRQRYYETIHAHVTRKMLLRMDYLAFFGKEKGLSYDNYNFEELDGGGETINDEHSQKTPQKFVVLPL